MNETLTIGQAVVKSAQFLREKGVGTPRLDAELLLAHALSCSRLDLYLRWDRPLDEEQIKAMREALRRRGQRREPVARIIGQREFYGRPFRVGGAAFVPRPETEWLVERSLALLAQMKPAAPPPPSESGATPEEEDDRAARAPGAPVLRVIDLGTGTGCIAISLALERPDLEVRATEISPEALQVARDNASALGAAGRVRFSRGDLFAGFEGPFDLVVSNPPYIATSEIGRLEPEVAAHDPARALDGGERGLDLIARIAAEAPPRMRPGAPLLLEIGEGQGAEARQLLESTGEFETIEVVKDTADLERYVEARRRAAPPPAPAPAPPPPESERSLA